MTALSSCTTPLCFMMPKKDAETDPFQQITGRIGSGPFTFNQSLDAAGQQVCLRQVGQIRAAQGSRHRVWPAARWCTSIR